MYTNADKYYNLIGLTVEQAKVKSGLRVRVVSEDGEGHIITMDLRSDRLNVAVIDGKISSIGGIG